MFDKTTDSTITEQLTIHGIYMYIEKQTGALKTRYLTTIDVLGPEVDAIKSGGVDTCISLGAATTTKRIIEYSAYDNSWSPDNFRSISLCVRAITRLSGQVVETIFAGNTRESRTVYLYVHVRMCAHVCACASARVQVGWA